MDNLQKWVYVRGTIPFLTKGKVYGLDFVSDLTLNVYDLDTGEKVYANPYHGVCAFHRDWVYVGCGDCCE